MCANAQTRPHGSAQASSHRWAELWSPLSSNNHRAVLIGCKIASAILSPILRAPPKVSYSGQITRAAAERAGEIVDRSRVSHPVGVVADRAAPEQVTLHDIGRCLKEVLQILNQTNTLIGKMHGVAFDTETESYNK